MSYPIYSQENVVLRSYILFSLLLSLCFLECRVRQYLKDAQGYYGLNNQWVSHCPTIWSLSDYELTTCFPKVPEKVNCTVLSSSYNVPEVIELYVNLKTYTRKCVSSRVTSCTGKFNLSIYYQINRKDYKRVILPDEIPKKNPSFDTTLYDANDDVSFSVDQNYKSLRLGLQAPFYCGIIRNVSVYYYLCPSQTIELVDLPEVIAPSKISSPYISVGTCTKNAVKKNNSLPLARKCYYNGTVEVIGSCECEPGFTNFYEKKRCKG